MLIRQTPYEDRKFDGFSLFDKDVVKDVQQFDESICDIEAEIFISLEDLISFDSPTTVKAPASPVFSGVDESSSLGSHDYENIDNTNGSEEHDSEDASDYSFSSFSLTRRNLQSHMLRQTDLNTTTDSLTNVFDGKGLSSISSEVSGEEASCSNLVKPSELFRTVPPIVNTCFKDIKAFFAEDDGSNDTSSTDTSSSVADNVSTSSVSSDRSQAISNDTISSDTQAQTPQRCIPVGSPPPMIEPTPCCANHSGSMRWQLTPSRIMEERMYMQRMARMKGFNRETFRTELCKNGDRCKHDYCIFAHHVEELRARVFKTDDFKQTLCNKFHSTYRGQKRRSCPFGAKCKFLHDEVELKLDDERSVLYAKQEQIFMTKKYDKVQDRIIVKIIHNFRADGDLETALYEDKKKNIFRADIVEMFEILFRDFKEEEEYFEMLTADALDERLYEEWEVAYGSVDVCFSDAEDEYDQFDYDLCSVLELTDPTKFGSEMMDAYACDNNYHSYY